MSLLIKALDKAEKAQEEEKKAAQAKAAKASRRRASNIANQPAELADTHLSFAEADVAEDEVQQEFLVAQYVNESTSSRAANVFEAKGVVGPQISPMVWVGLLGLICLLSIAGYFYYQLNHFSTVVPASQPLPVAQSTQSDREVSAPLLDQSALASQSYVETSKSSSVSASVNTPPLSSAQTPPVTSEYPSAADQPVSEIDSSVRSVAVHASPKKARSTSSELMQDSYPNIASESASIKIAKTRAVPPVNATLLQAYQAYLIQSDVEAQRLYKRVLQQDIRNIDALLGMGAIAERQVRVADAIGWFQKVLEVDPKNAVALSALVNLTPEVENKEQQLKGLLAKQPDNAALHVDLASIYAEDQRWVDAQQAYFEAFRLNPTPENAFNLAVSLDQLHKPKLALTYYQQSLALAQSVPNHSVDIPLLEARMRAIEAN